MSSMLRDHCSLVVPLILSEDFRLSDANGLCRPPKGIPLEVVVLICRRQDLHANHGQVTNCEQWYKNKVCFHNYFL